MKIFTANDITSVSETEAKLVDAILGTLTNGFKEQFDAAAEPGNFKTITVPRKTVVADAQTETGATLTPKVRAHLVVRAKECGFILDPLGGDKGKDFILSLKRRGGGRKPDTAEQKAAKAQAKIDADADAKDAEVAEAEADKK